MNETSLKKALSKLKIGDLRYFDSIGSTNDEALAWAALGAQDISIVVADEQTQGRGRLDRKWLTPKGSALAVSVILHLSEALRPVLSRTVGLAALSISDACLKLGLAPLIKWPNDILLGEKKAAGILIETVWTGNDVDSIIVGMGINIHKNSIPPNDMLKFPATSIEDEIKNETHPREEILANVLEALVAWRELMATDEFIKAWEERLAYFGKHVVINTGAETQTIGRVDGLEPDGSLRLIDANNKSVIINFGDVSLRPA